MHKLSGVNLIATGLVAALVATEFGMYVAQIAFLLEDNSLYGHSDLQRNQYRIILALLSLYLVTTIYAGAIGFVSLIKTRSVVRFPFQTTWFRGFTNCMRRQLFSRQY